MARSGAIGRRGNKGAGDTQTMKYTGIIGYFGKARAFPRPQGRNGEVRIIKEGKVKQIKKNEEKPS